MNYITLANLKLHLGITGSGDDTVLTNIANAVEKYVENYCGRTFTSTTYTNEEYEGTGTHQLRLKNYPIVSVSKIDYNEDYLENDSDWEQVDADDYWADGYHADRGIITANFIFDKYPSHYRITYVAGCSTIPEDLKLAIYELCGAYYNHRKNAGIDSETVGDYSVTFSNILTESKYIQDILTNYKDYSKSIL